MNYKLSCVRKYGLVLQEDLSSSPKLGQSDKQEDLRIHHRHAWHNPKHNKLLHPNPHWHRIDWKPDGTPKLSPNIPGSWLYYTYIVRRTNYVLQ